MAFCLIFQLELSIQSLLFHFDFHISGSIQDIKNIVCVIIDIAYFGMPIKIFVYCLFLQNRIFLMLYIFVCNIYKCEKGNFVYEQLYSQNRKPKIILNCCHIIYRIKVERFHRLPGHWIIQGFVCKSLAIQVLFWWRVKENACMCVCKLCVHKIMYRIYNIIYILRYLQYFNKLNRVNNTFSYQICDLSVLSTYFQFYFARTSTKPTLYFAIYIYIYI